MRSTPSESVDDIFRVHQLNVLKWLLLTMGVLLVPFDANHFIQGRYLLGVVLATTVVLFLVSAASIHFRQKTLIPHAIFFLPIAGTLWLAISTQGVSGVFWAYPCVLLTCYTLPRLQANVVAGILSLMATLQAYVQLSPEIALRVGATLVLTIVFANIFLGMISRLASRMGELATTDPLTGAYNRRQLESCIQRPVELKKRYGTPMSALLIDVDHFKKINDRFGHPMGDKVLKDMAARLRASIRAIDLLFRIGGEEFLVLLPESGLGGARRVAEKLRSAIAAQPIGDQQVTSSIGAGELEAGEESRDLLKRCDDALYQAKAGGRNRVCVSDGSPPAFSDPPWRTSWIIRTVHG